MAGRHGHGSNVSSSSPLVCSGPVELERDAFDREGMDTALVTKTSSSAVIGKISTGVGCCTGVTRMGGREVGTMPFTAMFLCGIGLSNEPTPVRGLNWLCRQKGLWPSLPTGWYDADNLAESSV